MEKSEIDLAKYTIPETTKEILLIMMEKIHKILVENNIKYWVDGGTLLGAIRHDGIIPWDDDIDLGVFDKDFEKIIPLFEKNMYDETLHIKLQRIDNNMIKIYIENLWMKNKETGQIFGTPTIDIFKYTRANDKVKLASIKERQRFKNCYYLKTELFPLKKYKFNNIIVMGANNPLGYLYRYYGNDCLTKYKVDVRKENNASHKDRNAIIQ
jgi:lipopolysaccharide cholinephosphotransferase